MKTYKQFMAETEKKKSVLPFIDKDGYGTGFATMGQHSIPKTPAQKSIEPYIGPDGYGVGFATIGTHSIPKKLKEDEQLPFRFMKSMGTSKKPAKVMPSKGLPSNTNRIDGFSPWNYHDYGDKGKIQHKEVNVEPMHKALSEHYKDYSPEHLHAIRRYTDGSAGLNRSLIDNHVRKTSVPEDYHDHIHKLDDAFTQHKTPHDMVTYSGTSHSPEHYPINAETGKRHMHFPAYTSTSINASVANGFASQDFRLPADAQHQERHVIKFHIPKGHPGMYLENHTTISGEHEMLLHRGMKAHIEPHPETVKHESAYGGTVTTHIWHAHVQPHDGNLKPITDVHTNHDEHVSKPVNTAHHDIPELPGEQRHIDANKKLGITKDW